MYGMALALCLASTGLQSSAIVQCGTRDCVVWIMYGVALTSSLQRGWLTPEHLHRAGPTRDDAPSNGGEMMKVDQNGGGSREISTVGEDAAMPKCVVVFIGMGQWGKGMGRWGNPT